METIISNIAGKIRRESLQGRLYLVAPLTMIVPGVLSGSRGSLYYPLEEIRKNPTAWNGMPITLGHPSIDGKPVSARTPEVLNTKALGMILRTQADQELISEGWFDIELTNRSAPGLIDRIEAGKKVEVSTGLGVQQEIVNGEYNGRAYQAIARNYQPDHLAILLDTPGACSINDGCGVNNEDELGSVEDITNAELPPNAKVDEPFRTPDGPRKFAVYVKDGDGYKIVRFGDPDMDIKRDDPERRKSFRARHQCDTNPGPKTKPKYWSCKFWEEGKSVSELLNERYEMTKEELNEMVGKKVKGKVMNIKGKTVTYERNGKMYKNRFTEKDGEIEMGDEEEMDEKVENQKVEIVNDLISNCECWEEVDREALQNMTFDKLTKLQEQSKRIRAVENKKEEVAKSSPQESQVDNAKQVSVEDWLATAPESVRQVFNEMQASIAHRRSELVSIITANKANPFTNDELNVKAVSELEKLARFAKDTLPTPTETVSRSAVYVGSGVINTKTKTEAEPSLLMVPTFDWAELSKANKN